MLANITAYLRPGCIQLQAAQQGTQSVFFIAERILAVCQLPACINRIFYPSPPAIQKVLEYLCRLLKFSMGIQFPSIIELLPRRKYFSQRKLLFVDPEVAVRVPRTDLLMGDGGLPLCNRLDRRDDLMDCPLP